MVAQSDGKKKRTDHGNGGGGGGGGGSVSSVFGNLDKIYADVDCDGKRAATKRQTILGR